MKASLSKSFRWVAWLALTAFLFGCRLEFIDNRQENFTPIDIATLLVVRDQFGQLESTFNIGESITFEVILLNRSEEEVTISFPNGQQYEIEVRAGLATVWNWSFGRSFIEATTSVTLGPGERAIYSTTWRQTANNMEALAEGEYQVRGSIPAIGNDIPSNFSNLPTDFSSEAQTIRLQ